MRGINVVRIASTIGVRRIGDRRRRGPRNVDGDFDSREAAARVDCGHASTGGCVRADAKATPGSVRSREAGNVEAGWQGVGHGRGSRGRTESAVADRDIPLAGPEPEKSSRVGFRHCWFHAFADRRRRGRILGRRRRRRRFVQRRPESDCRHPLRDDGFGNDYANFKPLATTKLPPPPPPDPFEPLPPAHPTAIVNISPALRLKSPVTCCPQSTYNGAAAVAVLVPARSTIGHDVINTRHRHVYVVELPLQANEFPRAGTTLLGDARLAMLLVALSISRDSSGSSSPLLRDNPPLCHLAIARKAIPFPEMANQKGLCDTRLSSPGMFQASQGIAKRFNRSDAPANRDFTALQR